MKIADVRRLDRPGAFAKIIEASKRNAVVLVRGHGFRASVTTSR